jgi:hypothetical protein
MLAIAGRSQFDLRTGQKQGEALPAQWVDIEQPDPADADLPVEAGVLARPARGETDERFEVGEQARGIALGEFFVDVAMMIARGRSRRTTSTVDRKQSGSGNRLSGLWFGGRGRSGYGEEEKEE